MKKVIINENQRGFLFKNGKYVRLLDAGKYLLFGDRDIEVSAVEGPVASGTCSLETLLSDQEIRAVTAQAEVGDQQIVLHYVDGKYKEALTKPGRYAFWTVADSHEFKTIDISNPEIPEDFPRYILNSLPSGLYSKLEVSEYQKARLFFDKKLVRILDAGTYYFWQNGIRIEAGHVDTRLTQMNITGQEMMTQDKVSVRVNFVCNYKVTDYVKILTEIDDYKEQLHVTAQLALREYIGRNRLDDILAGRDEMSRFVYDRLKEREKELFIEIRDAGVKDIILPGEVRDIMNTVLVAEKKAQANVITRREEVASTRSLLNTAKLMEENQTLYRLKELEFVERICENVGNINLNGTGDMLSQLLGMVRRSDAA